MFRQHVSLLFHFLSLLTRIVWGQQMSPHCVVTQFNHSLQCEAGSLYTQLPEMGHVRSIGQHVSCVFDENQHPWCSVERFDDDAGITLRGGRRRRRRRTVADNKAAVTKRKSRGESEEWEHYPWPALDSILSGYLCFHFINLTIGCVIAEIPVTPQLSANYSQWGDDVVGAPYIGWTPPVLQLVDPGDGTSGSAVGIRQYVHGEAHFFCFLLTNSSVRCAVGSDMVDTYADQALQLVSWASQDLEEALIRFPGVVPIWLSVGEAHICILYSDASVVCNGAECFDGRCSPPAGLRISSLACEAATCCGTRFDGSVAVWGLGLGSAIADNSPSYNNPPIGVYTQVSVGFFNEITAVVAGDASLRSWGLFSDEGRALWDIPASVISPLSLPCAVRTRYDPALTPPIVCWTPMKGTPAASTAALGILYLPSRLQVATTQFVSVTVLPDAVCVLLGPFNTTECYGDNSTSYFWQLPGPFPAGVRELRSDSQNLFAWMPDGSLVAWGKENFMDPGSFPFQNNSDYKFKQWGILVNNQVEPFVICGVLINSTACCFADGIPDGSLLPMDVLGLINSNRNHQSLPLLSWEAVYPCASLILDPRLTACGILSNGSAGCWGALFIAASDTTAPPVVLVPIYSPIKQLIVYQMRTFPHRAVVCTLAFNGTIGCWQWNRAPQFASSSWEQMLTPNGAFVSFASAWYVMYATRMADDTIVSWDPLASNVLPPPIRLPTVTLNVAPRFHYRWRSGPDLPCPPGTFSLGQGSISPLCSGLCSPGRYGNASQNINSDCAGICPLGTYCPAGTDNPIPCPAGTFGSSEGLTSATCSGSCSAGYYCPEGSIDPTLHPCSAGTYTSFSSSVPCQPCPLNSFSGATAAGCTWCPPNLYTATTQSSVCVPCPTGLECPGGGMASVSRGYWANLPPSSNNLSLSSAILEGGGVSVFRCPIGYCSGDSSSSGGGGTSESSLSNPCSPHRSTAFDNALCGECSAGYFEWNGSCMNCDALTSRPWLIILLLVCLLLFVLVLHRLTNSSKSDSARLAILLFFAQSISLLIQVRTDETILAFIHVANLSPTDTSGDNCLSQLNGTEMIAVKFLAPFFAFMTLGVIILGHFTWMKCSNRHRGREGPSNMSILQRQLLDEDALDDSAVNSSHSTVAKSFPFHAYARTGVTLLLASYQQWMTILLQSLQCVRVDQWSVLFSSPSVHCDSNAYHVWRIVAASSVGLLALAPIALAWRAHRSRGTDAVEQRDSAVTESKENYEMQSRGHQQQEAETSFSPSADDDNSQSAWDQLHLPFRPSTRWWLAVSLLRRVFFIGILLLPSFDSDAQGLALMYLCLGMLLAHVIVKPYRHEVENHLESIALIAILALTMLLAFPREAENNSSTSLQVVSALLVLPPLFILLVSNILVAWKTIHVRLAPITTRLLQCCARNQQDDQRPESKHAVGSSSLSDDLYRSPY